ncbi:cadherin-like and PC-esterase domain-containing protein 1 isoform X1 [Phyllopteryx taeniolatus]|uniref:cadherin-like and PC-esterase domain-containing protein 1 isoform X1 n=1 Tax=Phyllopteryx taeniolatus TaxID=161469 RepID=UPI002AD20CC3|nr:cadherin-like and PC-esterase domain-containing protein 1 isoform X1 [Phyllopteryx taeniolatus]
MWVGDVTSPSPVRAPLLKVTTKCEDDGEAMKMPWRRRALFGPLLVLLGAGGFLFYRTLNTSGNPGTGRSRARHDGRKLSAALQNLQSSRGTGGERRRAVLVIGRREPSDGEAQLYRRLLSRLRFHVQTSARADSMRQHGEGQWSLLVCVSSEERNCLTKMATSQLGPRQRVNLLPGLVEALSAVLTAEGFPITPPAGMAANRSRTLAADSAKAPPPDPVAVVTAFVLVTSLRPLSSFLHDVAVVTANQTSRAAQLRDLLLPEALEQAKRVIGHVLGAAVSANERAPNRNRCALCYQLLTFTLTFSGAITPLVTQVGVGLSLGVLSDEQFDRQVTRDVILEDTLDFLLSSEAADDDAQRDVFTETSGVRVSVENFRLLQNFHHHMMAPSSFQLVCPSVSWSCGSISRLSDVLLAIVRHSKNSRANRSDAPAADRSTGRCTEPRLRQIYFSPPLTLSPAFSPHVTQYSADVTFDTLVLRMRAETVSKACRAHPRVSMVPVGLGRGSVNILLTDADAPASSPSPSPRTLAIYTVHLLREAPPSLPMFGDHVTCSFLQDCGLVVVPGLPCGLESFSRSPDPLSACTSGHAPVSWRGVEGRWLVPCLSCSDNRTCDWREVTWQPDGCRHPLVETPRLRQCMAGKKVLFLGDSTNRGMMYFLLERLNSSLAAWHKAHDTLAYDNVNGGRTWAAYSYYPQFWLEPRRRPAFGQALARLLHRSRPLANSEQTVLVVGGVQWLTANHLQTLRAVLDRESLAGVRVVLKSLGMGFHVPADGVRSLAPEAIRNLSRQNADIIASAERHGYEVIDTLAITMGRYKDFLQGRCACHFHKVEKSRPGPSAASSYHVRGPVNEIYSEILLSRLCPTA